MIQFASAYHLPFVQWMNECMPELENGFSLQANISLIKDRRELAAWRKAFQEGEHGNQKSHDMQGWGMFRASLAWLV